MINYILWPVLGVATIATLFLIFDLLFGWLKQNSSIKLFVKGLINYDKRTILKNYR